MIRHAAAIAAAFVVTAVGAAAPTTLAKFTSTASASGSFSAMTVAPPTGLTAIGGTAASLSWTPTVSARTDGYLVLRSSTSGSGYAQVNAITPSTLTATTDAPSAGTWYYVLETFAGTWTSVNSNEASVVVTAGQRTTSTVGCDPTMQAPETSGAGNNDGYDLNPGNACASGSPYATDSNSGTDNVNSCSDPGKDRHRFWGYAFGLPGTVTSVDGITVTAIVGQSNSGGTSSVCLQVSLDGGTTWSAAKQIPLTAAALTSYTAGSSSDNWGHTWTAAQLSGSAFRIRVTDVATNPNKDFRLDYLGASVTYTP